MLRGRCLLPKKTHCYKPNSLKHKQRWFSPSPECLIFDMANCSFSSLPIDKTNSLQKQTTPKSTQLEIFHSSFNGICTFIIQSTQNNQRKTLLFKRQIHRHLICSLNQQILTHQCQHCQIGVFSMPNSCSFLPSQRNPLYKSCCQKQNSTLLHTIKVFLKSSSQKNPLQRAIKQLKCTKLTPLDSPQALSRCCVIGSCCGPKILILLPEIRIRGPLVSSGTERLLFLPTPLRKSFVSGCLRTSQTRQLLIVIRVCYSNNFCNWCYQSTCSIPKLNPKTKKLEKFRPHDYQIQSHFLTEANFQNLYIKINFLFLKQSFLYRNFLLL